MVSIRRISLALLAVSGALLSFVSPALAAGEPATVIVRVEGQNTTLLPPTSVTTTTAPVFSEGKSEDTCKGTSALGALQLATGGDWAGPWYAGLSEYEQFSILGESHPFGSGFYWALWTNHVESPVGACEAELEPGEEVLFFPCSEENGCEGPLGITVPADAVVGAPVSLVVDKYSSSGVPSAVTGATVTATLAGAAVPAAQAVTGSGGEATLTFPSAGEYTISATAPEAVRAETSVCVESSGSATCVKSSTVSPKGSSESTGGSTSTSGTTAQAIAASLLGVHEGQVYSARRAPRVLRGLVSAGGTTAAVRLRLTRRFRTHAGRVHCSYYDGTKDTFKAMRCGAQHGQYFTVGSQSSFSYLLPSSLAPGRYVLDLEATNHAGEHTALARGSTRFVFYVD